MRDISIDLKGASFFIQIIGILVIVGALWSVWAPLEKDVVGAKETLGLTAAALQSSTQEGAAQVAVAEENGRHIRIDLDQKNLTLLNGSDAVESFDLIQTPERSSPDAVLPGVYTVDKKSKAELSTITMVRFPYFVQFGDRYAMHGVPTDADGSSLELFAGSKVELKNADAEKVYNFVETGMSIYIVSDGYEDEDRDVKTLPLSYDKLPATSAQAYVISDVATGEVFLSKGADDRYPIASITKLVTAAVATDVIGHGVTITAPDGEEYTLSDLYYPLFLRSDNAVAECIAAHAGKQYFMANMNAYVKALGMQSTSFSDASGLSPKDISTASDLSLFARHLYDEKGFLLDMTHEEDMTITSAGGNEWYVTNQNKLASDPYFRGGKLGYTDEAGQTALSIFSVPFEDGTRSVAVVVLNSKDWKQDTRTLLRWVVESGE